MEVFIEKSRVIINLDFPEVECSNDEDNTTIRVVKLTVKEKDYLFTPTLFVGKKGNFCAVLYGNQTANLFKSRTHCEVLKDFNTTGLHLECNAKGIPLFFHKKG